MSETRTWPLVDRATAAFSGVGPDAVRLGDYLLDEVAVFEPKDVSGITMTITFDYDEGGYVGTVYVDG